MADPILQRRTLANRYKTIEFKTIPSLFKKHEDSRTWSKKAVLERLSVEHNKLPDPLKVSAARDLDQAASLRKQAMKLWPAGTAAAKRHWDWINILERMVAVLRTTNKPSDVEVRKEIVEKAPVVDEEEPWTVMDFDIYLQQMAHWRQTLAQIWDMARDDTKQMSVADIATGCAVRYFRSEMAAMELSFPEWYNKSGAFTPEIMKYMAMKEPNGLGGELTKVIESLRVKENVEFMQSVMNNAKQDGFPARADSDTAMWIVGDSARHRSPLIDWIIDIVKKNKDHIQHSELIVAWLFVQDSMKLSEERVKILRIATVRRLTKLLITHQPLKEILHDSRASELALDHLGSRVHAMNRYVMKQDTIPSLAVAHTWADYTNVMMNTLMFMLPALTHVAYLFDCSMILKRLDYVSAVTEVEQFCNRWHRGLYLGGRPKYEVTWKSTVKKWVTMETSNFKVMMTQQRIIERDKVWVRVAMDQSYSTPKEFGFKMRAGTDAWWKAIKERAAYELHEPSVIKIYQKVDAAYRVDDVRILIQKLLLLDWKKNRRAVEELLNTFQFSSDWFAGVNMQ
ncbi:hypothetical protein F4803DRAFT_553813 [Xylaria telfairii]|nr:hypothetical protein F4803DRAFT_553813 [Xylaria telfairii]